MPALPSLWSLKYMHDQRCTKIFQMKAHHLLQCQYVNDAVGSIKKRYFSVLTCCAPSPLTMGEVRRGISLLIIEVVSSNGGCSAIIDGTLIHKITCKKRDTQMVELYKYFWRIALKKQPHLKKCIMKLDTFRKYISTQFQKSHKLEDIFCQLEQALCRGWV